MSFDVDAYLAGKIDDYVEDIKTGYGCEPADYSELIIAQKKLMRKTGAKKLIKKLNEQIDLDFVKESNLIEGIKGVDLSAFLLDEETEIVHSQPQKRVLPKLDPKIMAKELVSGCVIMATNPRLGSMTFTTDHLQALKYTLAMARESFNQHIEKGQYAPLTNDIIQNINEMVTPEQNKADAKYRDKYTYGFCFVTGAKWTPVANQKVPARMTALLKWYNNETELSPIVRAAILHCEFIKIHPFCDGNGRAARLLVNYELAKHNLPTIVIKAKDKKAYYEALEKGITTGDVTDVAKIIEEGVKRSQQKQISCYNKQTQNNPNMGK